MGANEKVEATFHPSPHAALAAEARRAVSSEIKNGSFCTPACPPRVEHEHPKSLTLRLAEALEAADRLLASVDVHEVELLRAERDEWKRKFADCHPVHLDGVIKSYWLAAVIDKAKAMAQEGTSVAAMHAILAGADTDAALREVRAKAWDEAFAYSYWLERGYGDHECRTRGVPSHLIDDIAEWNPYREGK